MEDKMEGTSWEELGISNDFLFGRILKDTFMPFGIL